MRILHLTDRASARGGADWHLLGVLAAQVAEHDLLLAVGRADGSATLPCEIAMIAGLAEARATSVREALDRLRAGFGPDLIHLHNIVNPEALAWGADHRAVMTVQDHRTFCPGRGKLTADDQPCPGPMSTSRCAACFDDPAYFERLLALTGERLAAVARMAAVTVLSTYMKEELTAVGLTPARVHVIPPFVHGLDLAAAPSGPPCVLFAGRLAATKGIADAIAAWERADTGLPLVFAGSGPERGGLEAAGHTVLGWIPHNELAGIYRRAAALLMPSRWQEPFGIVGLEAMSLRVPVVAYDGGGVREWHPGPPDLVPWGDVEALAHALRAAVGRRPVAGIPARFEQSMLMRKLKSLYESLSGGSARRVAIVGLRRNNHAAHLWNRSGQSALRYAGVGARSEQATASASASRLADR